MTAILKKVIKAEATRQCSQDNHAACPAHKSKDGCWHSGDRELNTIAKMLFGSSSMRCICVCHNNNNKGADQ